MRDQKIYDVIGIGIGPFNLGLAALTHDLPELSCLFFDSKEQFDWHAGMLIPGTRMQVPFYSDLVTLADPCNKFSYFNFLKAGEKMIRFGVLENIYPLRTEYNQYCRWVAGQLPALHFGHTCQEIRYCAVRKCYEVFVTDSKGKRLRFFGRHVVIGIGTVPALPDGAKAVKHEQVFHSAEYLFKKPELLKKKAIMLIGSGQSAAEIFSDLLNHANEWEHLCWFTRSERICPMDYSKFALELTSPAYIEHFYGLSHTSKENILPGQENLYKRVNMDTMAAIYEQLHMLEHVGGSGRITIMPSAALQEIAELPDGSIKLNVEHQVTGRKWEQPTEALILATGYRHEVPGFVEPVRDRIQWTSEGRYNLQANYAIDREATLFVQNADLHTHGFNSADLGMGPYRNAVIINAIMGRERYRIEKGSIFQCFEQV